MTTSSARGARSGWRGPRRPPSYNRPEPPSDPRWPVKTFRAERPFSRSRSRARPGAPRSFDRRPPGPARPLQSRCCLTTEGAAGDARGVRHPGDMGSRVRRDEATRSDRPSMPDETLGSAPRTLVLSPCLRGDALRKSQVSFGPLIPHFFSEARRSVRPAMLPRHTRPTVVGD